MIPVLRMLGSSFRDRVDSLRHAFSVVGEQLLQHTESDQGATRWSREQRHRLSGEGIFGFTNSCAIFGKLLVWNPAIGQLANVSAMRSGTSLTPFPHGLGGGLR